MSEFIPHSMGSRFLEGRGIRVLALRCFLAVLAVTCAVGCQKSLTHDECDRLLERYTDKVIDQARPSTSQAERRDLFHAARKKADLDPEFAKCSQRVSRKEFDCAMQAHNADQIERCLM